MSSRVVGVAAEVEGVVPCGPVTAEPGGFEVAVPCGDRVLPVAAPPAAEVLPPPRCVPTTVVAAVAFAFAAESPPPPHPAKVRAAVRINTPLLTPSRTAALQPPMQARSDDDRDRPRP